MALQGAELNLSAPHVMFYLQEVVGIVIKI
jgi:hypothetical protein